MKYLNGVISTDSSDSPSVLSLRPQRLRTWGRLSREDRVPNGTFPTTTNVHRGCVTGEFPSPTLCIYPYDRWNKDRVHFRIYILFSLLLAFSNRNTNIQCDSVKFWRTNVIAFLRLQKELQPRRARAFTAAERAASGAGVRYLGALNSY
jgi:hypothetical protein